MAALTLVTAFTPFNLPWKQTGVLVRKFTGAGTDSTTLAAADSGKRYIILGGRISFDGAERMDILSGTTVIDSIEAPARCTANFPKGLECITGELLALNKAGAAVTVRGWVAFKAIKDGEDTYPMTNA